MTGRLVGIALAIAVLASVLAPYALAGQKWP
jgi:hypothetical protein